VSAVIFARPRHNYDSYQDMYSLIRLSGYPLIYFDELDPASDNTYILTMVNGENQHGWQDARARIILYDLEWRLNGDYPRIPGVAEVWAADLWYAQQIAGRMDGRVRYVTLGSHPGLNMAPDDEADKAQDVIMLAYMTNRRLGIAAALRARGLSLSDGGWGQERHRNILQTRVMLHVHQHDGISTIAPQRFALAAAYRMPLISETACEPGPVKDAVLWANYDALPEVVAERVRYGSLADYGEALYQVLCVERPFRKCVEEAL
jgi:hypothetical protein